LLSAYEIHFEFHGCVFLRDWLFTGSRFGSSSLESSFTFCLWFLYNWYGQCCKSDYRTRVRCENVSYQKSTFSKWTNECCRGGDFCLYLLFCRFIFNWILF